MYSFRISRINGSVEVTTKMVSLLSPKMALEQYGFKVEDSSFEKGDIQFFFYGSQYYTVSIHVQKDNETLYSCRNEEFINVLIVEGKVVLTSPHSKMTIEV